MKTAQILPVLVALLGAVAAAPVSTAENTNNQAGWGKREVATAESTNNQAGWGK